MDLLFVYLIIINAIGFLLMTADKHKARKKQRRIPERVLFGAVLAGGSIGIWLAMYLVRHKTRHISFALGIPAILAMQILILGYFFFH